MEAAQSSRGFVVLLACWIAVLPTGATAQGSPPPNVVVFLSDDQGWTGT